MFSSNFGKICIKSCLYCLLCLIMFVRVAPSILPTFSHSRLYGVVQSFSILYIVVSLVCFVVGKLWPDNRLKNVSLFVLFFCVLFALTSASWKN